MSSTFRFYQTYGTTPTDVAQGTGNGSNDWDFKSAATPGCAGAAEAIRAGDYSAHVYLKGRFDGTFSQVSNVRFWATDLSALPSYGAGAFVLASGTATYVPPSTASMSGVWQAVPTARAQGLDVGTAGLASGLPGCTNYVALQLKTGVSGVVTGTAPYLYFALGWDEV